MEQSRTKNESTLPLTAIAEGRYGKIHYLVNDDPIGQSLREYGEWGQIEIEKILQLIHDGDHVLDVGANVGAYTLAFSCKVGSSGKVLSFEAQPFINTLLKATIDTGKLTNVDLIENAVSDKAEILYFDELEYAEHINAGAVKLSESDSSGMQQVHAITIDQLSLAKCELIKCDVEGMSNKVIAGALETIKKFKPIIVSEVNDVAEGVDLFNALHGLSYEVWMIQSPAYNPNNFNKNKKNIFGYAAEVSFIAVHPSNRLKAALDAMGTKIESHDHLAMLILQCPRFGDLTDYDRNYKVLRSKLEDMEERVCRLADASKRFSYRAALLEKRMAGRSGLAAENKRLEEANGALMAQLRDAQMRLNQLYSSRSWRLMAPARFAFRFVRRFV
ncbi:hypothetical protein BR10RB9215_C10241 [Brucella sp. 10RB9215]|uniref:FkbM family methyltransferase n=1 Tax=Brucella sp. 10RB9215 TaxID=1149953 RepID=UPI00090A5BAB|nr:FkbM family methyltransferase [Brucella sp. 10RB9215]SBW13436.1 hypothetical protein BR10RB9215_C10241 [Brucella sp. 10RB9215]